MDISDIRRANILALAEKHSRSVLAKKLGYSDTIYINQLCGGHGSFGGRTARKIEKSLNLADGWMDQLHSNDSKLSVREDSQGYNPGHNKIPLISRIQAGDLCEATDPYSQGDAERWILCPTEHSSSTYALEVRGISMEPMFTEGNIIAVDPEREPQSGKFVVAKHLDDNEATFKQLIIDGGRYYLKALNPDWPTPITEMDEKWHICGVAICRIEEL